ncbi:MAG: NF038122 family metalloprotease, partial [Caulobacterales bacterium]
MHINITYDASAASAPAGFEAAVQAAVQFFETTFATPITVNITFGWGTVGGQPMDPGALGESVSTYLPFSYAAVRTALQQDAVTPYAQLAAHFLPSVDPTNGGEMMLTSADAKALGLADGARAGLDGSVGLDASSAYTFDASKGVAVQTYDAVGVLGHEISEVLGRQSFVGFTPSGGSPEFGLLDLLRYKAAGQLDPTSPTGSFSLDGHTLLMAFNNPGNGGDSGDWATSGAFDSFNAFATIGQPEPISTTDLAVMEVLGYHQTLQPPLAQIPNTTPITGEVVTQDTTIAQGQSVYFDEGGYFIEGALSGNSPSLTNSGLIVDIGSSSLPLTNDPSGSFFTGSLITNSVGGAIYSEALVGDAYGHSSGSWGPNLLNQGLIQVVSLDGDAFGVVTGHSNFQFVNAGSGTLTVWARHAAIGLNMSLGNNGGSFTNAGDIEVTGASAVGVMGATSFNNSGTIKATSLDLTKPSIGVDVIEENAPSYANSGTISGDYSFFVDPSGTSPPTKPNIDLINTGTMQGAISLGAGVNQIHNSGAIKGDIRFGNGDSTYDGAGGHLTGAIFLGHAVNTVTLGADNGVVYGGGGADAITGGAGNDFIEIARGNNAIDGGAGFNTLSFADSDTGVTVDLGAGTAVGAGNDTLKNIQEVIGSSFNNTLKAGAAAATLVAGAGHDTLIGGAGGDTLVAGSGGDVMTGGGGNNAFIYSAGDQQLVITDFKAGGDHDLLKVFGYAGPGSVTQQGADTLITLSGGDSILLNNVLASSLTGADVVYDASAYKAPPVPASLPIFGSSPIDFTTDLTIYAGEHINETGQPYGLFDDAYGFSMHSLDNFGAVTVTGAIGSLYGLKADPSANGGVFTNETGASFTVSNSGGPADGVFGPEWAPGLVNAGQFSVSATGVAIGVYAGNLTASLVNTASGVISVSSSGDSAYGLDLPNGGSLQNDGKIVVSAVAKATSYYTVAFLNDTIVNNGVIQATSTGGDKSWGFVISGFDEGAGHGSLTNTGVITAQTAILDEAGPFSPPSAPSVAIVNSGSIHGDIDLGGSQSSLTNTGMIVGDILLHDDNSMGAGGGDTIDLRGGQFTGDIAISPGLNGGHSTVNDLIETGAGSTLIKVAGGEPQLSLTVNGSASGQTTVQFDIASTAASETHNADGSWTVNAGTDGVETLSNVQTLQFTDKLITLGAAPAAHDFNADGNSDILFGQSNGTLAIWEMSGTTIVGGGSLGAPGGTWAEKGIGDFNHDGKADVLFQDGSGNIAIWEMNGTAIIGGGAIGNPGGTWQVKGVGDFNADGSSDILFQDGAGNLAIWEMNGTAIIGGGAIGNPGGTWQVKGTGDFNGDGKSDILFADASGNLAIWEMNGTAIIGGGAIGNPGGTWQVK